jgi:hypothetical protein
MSQLNTSTTMKRSDLSSSPRSSSSSSSPSVDAELVTRLRAALKECAGGSTLLPSEGAAENTVEIPESEVVLLVLSAAMRRVDWLEEQLAKLTASAGPPVAQASARDPDAVMRLARANGTIVDDDDDAKSPAKPTVVSTLSSQRSSAAAPAAAAAPRRAAMQRSRSSTQLAESSGGGDRPSKAPTSSALLTKIEITGVGLTSAMPGRAASIAVRFVGADGKPKHVSGKTAAAIFRPPHGANEVPCNVTKCRDGSFAISYVVPTTCAVDEVGLLSVFIDGKPSKHSPYTVNIVRNLR